jgi:hypothetical protein
MGYKMNFYGAVLLIVSISIIVEYALKHYHFEARVCPCRQSYTESCDVSFEPKPFRIAGDGDTFNISRIENFVEIYSEHVNELATCIKKMTVQMMCYENELKTRTKLGMLCDEAINAFVFFNNIVYDAIYAPIIRLAIE